MDKLIGKQALETMIYRYPQLSLKPFEGMSQSEDYRKIARQGIFPEVLINPFITSDEDELFTYEYKSPSSNWTVDILFMAERFDFEQFMQVISHKGEPVTILPSVGACTYKGLNNWRKINDHEEEYKAAGHTDLDEEFNRFISDPANYKDSLIIISNGYYSAIDPESVGMDNDEWRNRSRVIRTFHELLHYYLRMEDMRDIDPIVEEVFADAVGLCYAFGEYNDSWAKLFLGIESETYREGGRLQHYVKDGLSLEEAISIAYNAIDKTKEYLDTKKSERRWKILDDTEELYNILKIQV